MLQICVNLSLRQGPQQNHQPLGQPRLKLCPQLQRNNLRNVMAFAYFCIVLPPVTVCGFLVKPSSSLLPLYTSFDSFVRCCGCGGLLLLMMMMVMMMMMMSDDGDDFRRTQRQMKKSLQPQRQVQLHTFIVCPRSHLHAMLRQRISFDTFRFNPELGKFILYQSYSNGTGIRN